MAESKIISLLQERTDELCRRGVSLIVLLCTGMFSKELVASVPVIYPQKLLYSIVPILAGGRKQVSSALTPSKPSRTTRDGKR